MSHATKLTEEDAKYGTCDLCKGVNRACFPLTGALGGTVYICKEDCHPAWVR